MWIEKQSNGKFKCIERYTAPFVRNRLNDTGEAGSTLNERLKRFKALIRWGYKNDYLEDIKFIDKIEKP